MAHVNEVRLLLLLLLLLLLGAADKHMLGWCAFVKGWVGCSGPNRQ
jgi:hypothetical protein